MDLSTQLGFFTLQYAKLRMLSFYYDCVAYFLNRDSFQLVELDTDSLYMALAGDIFEELVCDERRDEYLLERSKWFPRSHPEQAVAYDKREPGLFKEEFRGSRMVCLAAKTYAIDGEHGVKFSCKGANKRSVSNPVETMSNVIKTKESSTVVNRGIKRRNGETITYAQKRRAFAFEYFKRKVCNDGVSTLPLDI